MDRSQHDPPLPTSTTTTTTNNNNRVRSVVSRPSADSPRLQKKRSVKRVRSDAARLTRPDHLLHDEQPSDEVTRQKSTSLRNAVRKIFGRRSRLAEEVELPSSIQTTPIKHKAHRSEPPEVTRTTDLPPRPNTADRAASTPIYRDSPTSITRIRSPNAVEFPKSRQLKPLNLPAPFEDPRATLRRRKTLPSILLPEQDAKEIAAAIASAGPYPTASSFDLVGEPPLPSGLNVTTKAARRRSRSAGDLREQALQVGPVRKRSDEIRFWRESIQTTVLRASGFQVPLDKAEPLEQLSTPPRVRDESSPPVARTSPGFDINSASAYGTEFSRDLEDRVAKLEANLNFFQRSLQKLHSDRSRRAGIPRLRPVRRDDDRTPSMLIDDLQTPFTPSHYMYDIDPPRPSTAPNRPQRPARPDVDAPPMPPIAQAEPPTRSPPPRPARPDEVAQQGSPSADNPTFRSLYRMLTDERSARRKLETQVRDMRTEITDLQYQVTSQSHVQSQRSSYLFSASSEAGAGSARLRDLLGQLEGPQSAYHTPPPRASAMTDAVVSRFSGSTRQDSEAETGATREGDERHMNDSERTPRPEQSRRLGFQQQATYSTIQNPYVDELASYRRQQELEAEGEMF